MVVIGPSTGIILHATRPKCQCLPKIYFQGTRHDSFPRRKRRLPLTLDTMIIITLLSSPGTFQELIRKQYYSLEKLEHNVNKSTSGMLRSDNEMTIGVSASYDFSPILS